MSSGLGHRRREEKEKEGEREDRAQLQTVSLLAARGDIERRGGNRRRASPSCPFVSPLLSLHYGAGILSKRRSGRREGGKGTSRRATGISSF